MSTFSPFVVVDPSVKLKPGKDLSIRSHCMQGRNKRAGSRRSEQEKRKNAKLHRDREQYRELASKMLPSVNDSSIVRLISSNIGPEARDLLLKGLVYNFTNLSLTPFERCVDFDKVDSVSFRLVFTDAAYVNSILCSTSAIHDIASPTWNGQPGRRTTFYLRETLSLLRKKLSQGNVQEDEAMIFAVIQLAMLAAVFGDWEAAITHFSGLQKMVQLRGGNDFLSVRPKLRFKLDRLDLAYSLSSGKQPFFLSPTVSWNTSFNDSATSSTMYQPPADWDCRLTTVFCDFQRVANGINFNVRSHARHNAECFQGVLSSLQTRLMHLEHSLHQPVEQLVRLSLLALLTTTFKVPGRKIPYFWLAQRLETTFAEVCSGLAVVDPVLQQWIVVVAAISICESVYGWPRGVWGNRAMEKDWGAMKTSLLGVVWIECIHDKLGEEICQKLSVHQVEERRLVIT